MNAYFVKAKYDNGNGHSFDVELNIFANSVNEANNYFDKHITTAPAFYGDCWDDEEQIKSCMKKATVEEFNDTCFKGKEINFTIPLIGGKQFVDGYCGNWEEAKEEILNTLNDDVGKLARIYLSDPLDNSFLFHMENPYYNPQTSNAISNCIARGIDPFGC